MYSVPYDKPERHIESIDVPLTNTYLCAKMKALVYQGDGKCGLEDRPVPKIQEPTDAIVKRMDLDSSEVSVG